MTISTGDAHSLRYCLDFGHQELVMDVKIPHKLVKYGVVDQKLVFDMQITPTPTHTQTNSQNRA
jgi:hypothetical protein